MNRTELSKHLGLVAGYTALALFMTYPAALHMRDQMPGGAGDPLLTCWYIEHNIQKIVALDFQHFFDGNTLYPNRLTSAFSEHFAGTSWMGLPVYYLSGKDIVFTYNFLLILSFIMTCWGMHLLAYEFTRKHLPSILAALIFAYAPSKIGHIEQLHMISTYWFPFVFLFLYRLIMTPSYRHALLFALFFVLNAMASAFYMVAAAMGIAVFLPLMLWSRRHSLLTIIKPLGLAVILIAVSLPPLYTPYFIVRSQFDFERSVQDNRRDSARPSSYLGTPKWQGKNLLYGRVLGWDRFTRARDPLFPGLVAILCSASLLLMILRRVIRPSALLASFFIITLLAFLISLGPVWDKETGRANPVFMLFYTYFPSASSMRVPARYGVLVSFGMAILTAFCVGRLLEGQVKGWAKSLGLLPVIAGLEYVSIPIALEPRPSIDTVRDVYDWVRAQPPGTPILEIPSNNFWINAQYVFFANYHRQPLVNGYSSFFPPIFRYLHCPAPRLLDPDHLEVIRQLGVKHIIVHERKIPPEERVDLQKALDSALRSDLVPSGVMSHSRVYTVVGAVDPHSLPRRLGDHPVAIQVSPQLSTEQTVAKATLVFSEPPPPILLAGLIIPENRNLEALFYGQGGAALSSQHCRLQYLDSGTGGSASFTFHPPPSEGHYVLVVKSRGKPIAQTVFVMKKGGRTSRAPGILRADISLSAPRVTISSNALFRSTIHVTNIGDTMWLAASDDRKNPATATVRLGAILEREGIPVRSFRSLLPFDLAPGNAVDLVLAFRMNCPPGSYRLKLDMVNEHVTWFEPHGSKPIWIDVDILPETLLPGAHFLPCRSPGSFVNKVP